MDSEDISEKVQGEFDYCNLRYRGRNIPIVDTDIRRERKTFSFDLGGYEVDFDYSLN